MDAKQEIEVAVLARNAQGQTDFIVCRIEADAAQIADGTHFVQANRQVQQRGFQPLAAFDSAAPAWQVLANGLKYKRFFDDATEILQDALVPERDCSGADTISLIDELFKRHHADEVAYVALSADGYWSTQSGWIDDPQWATLVRDAAQLQQLQNRGALAVLAIRLDRLDDLLQFPGLADLQHAAEGALARSQRYGFAIDENNAAEVLTEELALSQFTPASAATSLLGPYLLHVQQQDREELARRSAERA